MTLIERFIQATRQNAPNPLMQEPEKNKALFENFSMGLFNAKFIEVFSSNVFPETVKFKNGDKFLLWDSAYWNIFYNIITIHLMSINMQDNRLSDWIKQRLQAEIYYFLALKTVDYIELSVEFSRCYSQLKSRELLIEVPSQNLKIYGGYVYEIGFIAKIYCLFHELNHMDNFEDSILFREKVNALIDTFKTANQVISDNPNFLESVREHYSTEKINATLCQIINHKIPDLEIELTCDLAALNDTVDFFKQFWPDMTEETIFSKVNEVVIVINSINFALAQTYRYWKYSYELYSKEIDMKAYSKYVEQANQDAILRYVLSDIAKAIQANSLYGDEIIDILSTDQYGLRYRVENPFTKEALSMISDKTLFDNICFNVEKNKNVSEEKLEHLRNTLLDW